MKDRSGRVQMFVGEEDDLVARLKFNPKKKHDLAKSVRHNETAQKRHTKH